MKGRALEIGETFYARTRKQWRSWLERNHDRRSEIWLITFKRHTEKTSVPYNDAVEEALCFGWIDSIVKRLDDDRTVQRYTPRKPGSNLSETNAERARRLISEGLMTDAGLSKIRDQLERSFVLPEDILEALRSDPEVLSNFMAFPESYKRIRVGWIEGARTRPAEFQKRLRYFIKMTKANKTYGMVR